MNRIINLVSKEYISINQAAIVLAVLAFLSQILGLLRDRSLAAIIGPSQTLDVYYAAFRIPDFLYLSIASIASITVLLPFLVERLRTDTTKEEHQKGVIFFSGVFYAFLFLLIGISALLWLAMPLLAHAIAPGFSAAERLQFVSVSRLMLLSPILLGMSNMLGSITQLYRKFFIYALSPVLYNLGIILGIYFFYPVFGGAGLALGVVLGGVLHLIVQLPTISKHSFFPKLTFKFNWKEIKEVTMLSLPRTIGLSMGSFTTLVLVALISKLQTGAISIFNFSYNLQAVPISIIGISYGTAAFPALVSSFATNKQLYLKEVFKTSRAILFWSMPVTVIFIVLRAQIVRVVLGAGVFSWNDTRLTAASLALLAIGLVSQSLCCLFIRAYYAAGNTMKTLIANGLTEIFTIAGAFFLYAYFKAHPAALNDLAALLRVQNIPGVILLAFPLAYAIFGGIFNIVALMFLFYRDYLPKGQSSGFLLAFGRDTISSLALGGVSYIALQFLATRLNQNRFFGVLLQGTIAGVLGIAAWAIANELMGDDEYKNVKATFKRKIWSKLVVIVPEQEEL